MLLQVHKATLLSSGEVVAVKVQYPGAERVMMSDLTNLKALAAFLQKFELNFDILSR
jgi:aarF domain-containing kinase